MLPDFPKIKLLLRKYTNSYLQNLIKSGPLFSKFKETIIFEGDRFGENYFTKMTSEILINRTDIITNGPWSIIFHLEEHSKNILKQKSELFFKTMDDATKKSGNRINARGKKFSFELFLELLEKITIDFDDDGNPKLPELIVGPELMLKLKLMIPEWESNEEYTKKFEQIIKKKRQEWNDSESNRKLVD